MGEIHRAFYGEHAGGHQLLATSAPGLAAVNGVLGATDRPWAVDGEWAPYVSGLPFGNHFVLMRSFPAPSRTGGRGGFVFTDALFIERADVANIPDLRRLLALLSRERPETPSPPGPIPAPVSDEPPCFAPDRRACAAAREILARENSVRPVVWLGQDGFEDLLARIWAGLWPSARMELRFRASFDPADVENGTLMLVCTPQVSRARWAGFPVIDPTDGIDDPSPAEALLAGEATALSLFVSAFGLDTANIQALRQAEAAVGLLRDLGSLASEQIRLLLRLLIALGPNPSAAPDEKARVARQLAAAIPHADALFIHSLRNVAETPLGGSTTHLRKAVQEWVNTQVGGETTNVATWLRDPAEAWWTSAVRAGVEGAVRTWKQGIAPALWAIWEAAPSEIQPQLSLALAHGSAERDLARTCPPTLAPDAARHIVAVARPEDWPELFAVAIASAHGPAAAIRKLTKGNGGQIESVLHGLADRYGGAVLIDAAVSSLDRRAIDAAAQRIVREPDLLSRMEADHEGWRSLWLRAIKLGVDPWKGISTPLVIRDRVLTRVAEAGDVEPDLLDALARTRLADLTDHPRRKELWGALPDPARTRFLGATATAWIERFRSSPDSELLPEEPILSAARRNARLLELDIRNPGHSVHVVASAFERVPGWDEVDFLRWLRSARPTLTSFPATGAERLGRVIKAKGWRDAASEIYSGRNTAAVMRAMVPTLFPLLGMIQQCVAAWEGLDRGEHRKPDWYEALLEFALHLYPNGPDHNRIWQRAGGDQSRIEGNSPYERWSSAIWLLRSGGAGRNTTPKSLTWEMCNDYMGNADLRSLHANAP